MRGIVRLGFVCALAIGATGAASAQNHSECWYVQKSGYNVRGTQPSSADIWAAMKDVAVRYNIPVELLAAISYQESNWTQFASDGVVVHNKGNCTTLYRTGSLSLTPPDVGLMQLFAVTARQFDVPRLVSDWRYNLECGARVLTDKWSYYYGSICPRWYPGRTNDHDRKVLENWWYPLKMYNGWANLSDFGYVTRVYDTLWNVPSKAAPFVPKLWVTRPWEAVPKYTLPPAAYKYYTYFKATASGTWTDGYGYAYSFRTHVGTIGTTPGTGPDPVPSVDRMMLTAYKATATVNVRSGPGAGFTILGTLPGGHVVVSDAVQNGWVRIFFNGGYGWCTASYMARTTGVTGMACAVAEAHVRSGPSSGYSVLGKVKYLQVHVRAGTSGGWTAIRWGGKTAWLGSGLVAALGL